MLTLAARRMTITGICLAAVLGIAGCSPLHDAIRRGDVGKVRSLLEQGANVDKRDAEGLTPLHLAAWKGNAECVALLLGKGADINAESGVLNSPLHLAALRGSKPCVELLLKAGAYVNVRNAAVEAYWRERSEWIRVRNIGVIETGLLPYVVAPEGATLAGIHFKSIGATPLNLAARGPYPEVMRVLIEHGANVNALSPYGTPLRMACAQLFEASWNPRETTLEDVHRRAEQAIRLLVEKGAGVDRPGIVIREFWVTDPNQTRYQMSYGKTRTPLWMAVQYQNRDLVRLFLEHGANPNATWDDDDPERPLLHVAAASSSADIEIVRLLIDHGADVNAEGRYTGILGPEKRTTLRAAKNKEIKALLRQHGAKERSE
ncbi:MAG: ankyrin repeat domain-containing protein [Sedimentisphaerales bacterium]|nr:ankyrin repeat domain-containing protein [Sedimentisphaerales bacterium]